MNKSKTRSRSAGPGDNEFDGDNSVARSVSADRAGDSNDTHGKYTYLIEFFSRIRAYKILYLSIDFYRKIKL